MESFQVTPGQQLVEQVEYRSSSTGRELSNESTLAKYDRVQFHWDSFKLRSSGSTGTPAPRQKREGGAGAARRPPRPLPCTSLVA
eukprot:354574-Chlamydomonas_euryale.AAC.7